MTIYSNIYYDVRVFIRIKDKMPFDIESNTQTYSKKQNNCFIVTTLVIIGILILSGVTLGILYGTGVIWNTNSYDGIHTADDTIGTNDTNDHIIIKNINKTYEFQTNVPFETNNRSVIWYDEFEGDTLDPTKWNSIIPYGQYSKKNQRQIYTNDPANLNVANGTLNIIPTFKDGIYSSAWVDTQNKFSFFPGMVIQNIVVDTIYVEASIKIDHPGQGFWPAFWLSPTNHTRYGKSPGSGEIDIMETINDMNMMYNVIHFGGSTPENRGRSYKKVNSPTGTWAGDYHTYSVSWSLSEITFSINGDIVVSMKPRSAENPDGWYSENSNNPSAPFDAPFYIIFNFAIGGPWPKDPDDTTEFPNGIHADYIRVFSI
ncbi:(1-3)-beta-glucanase [Paramecium bursaria Chlorella virus MA1E]|nr:(1-3)-beta-glucanase [Paramecium bursaria Chlorella virus MA1E]